VKRQTYVFRGYCQDRGYADVPLAVLVLEPDVLGANRPGDRERVRKLLTQIRDAIAGHSSLAVTLTRQNPRTLVHGGMAQAALYHVLSGRGAPLADLYVGKAWARKVARVFAGFYREPVRLVEHANWPHEGREVWDEPTERVAANPSAPWPPLVNEVWHNWRTGEDATVRTVKGNRAELMSHRSGMRGWLDRPDLLDSWKPAGRGNPRAGEPDPWTGGIYVADGWLELTPAQWRKLSRERKGRAEAGSNFAQAYGVGTRYALVRSEAGTGMLAPVRLTTARAPRRNARRAGPELPKSHRLAAKLVRSLGFNAMAHEILSGKQTAPRTLQALLSMKGVPESRKVILRHALQALEREAGGARVVSSAAELAAVKREAFGQLSRELGRPVRVPNRGRVPTHRQALGMLKRLEAHERASVKNPSRLPRVGTYWQRTSYPQHLARVASTERAKGAAPPMVTLHVVTGHGELMGTTRLPVNEFAALYVSLPASSPYRKTLPNPHRPAPAAAHACPPSPGAQPVHAPAPAAGNPLPRWADPRSIRTVRSGRALVRVACPRGHFHPRARGRRKCDVATRALEVLTPNRGRLIRERVKLLHDVPGLGRTGDVVTGEYGSPPPGFGGFAGWEVLRGGRVFSLEEGSDAQRIGRENPVPEAAAQTFRMWHEFDPPSRVKPVRVPSRVIPRHVVRLGEITRIDYRSDKWNPGRVVTYTHTTRAPRPILVTGPGARGTYIVGGRMRVTPDGLVN